MKPTVADRLQREIDQLERTLAGLTGSTRVTPERLEEIRARLAALQDQTQQLKHGAS